MHKSDMNVTVKGSTLRIDNRICTIAMFKQIPEKDFGLLIKDKDGDTIADVIPGSTFLGHVDWYLPAADPELEDGTHKWIIWTDGEKLYKGAVDWAFPMTTDALHDKEMKAHATQLFIGS